MSFIPGDWLYDEETFPNCWTLCTMKAENPDKYKVFEISDRKNESKELFKYLNWMVKNDQRMVGFNNLGFDYPILHKAFKLMKIQDAAGEEVKLDHEYLYDLAQEQINSFKDGFGSTVSAKEELIKQVDLYKINHFDNKAKSTSLKMLEFNMRSPNIEDLPYAVGTTLTDEQKDVLITYNIHDVKETLKFYVHNLDALRLRADLGDKFGIDFTNFNDTKIGKEYFINQLETAIPGSCYTVHRGKRTVKQTKRPSIAIKDCLFDYYDFKSEEFKAVFQWFKEQRINETKGVFSELDEGNLGRVADFAEMETKRKKFPAEPSEQDLARFTIEHPLGWVEIEELKATTTVKNADGTKTKVHKKSYWGCWREAGTLNVSVNGFRFDFGTGGIHGSISNKIARENRKYIIKDADVASMYPNLGISNRVYPKHLGVKFCDIYEDVYNQRKSYKKGTPENAVMKLALNGVYGDSNNKFSPFYDPQYTMTITINGQLSLCLLAEKLLTIPDLKLIQVNTDGVTVALPRESEDEYNRICKEWQEQVKLELEFADYSTMYIRDVNNYIAVYTNGKVKRKGAYQYEGLGWHQNHSALIIPKAAEAAMLYGKDVEEFIRESKDMYDFMLRTKVPRSSSLVLRYPDGFDEDGKEIFRDEPQQNICRYYPSVNGGKLIKTMPALAKSEDGEDREFSIDKDWNVKTCNNVLHFSFDDLDYSYYVSEANKLIFGR